MRTHVLTLSCCLAWFAPLHAGELGPPAPLFPQMWPSQPVPDNWIWHQWSKAEFPRPVEPEPPPADPRDPLLPTVEPPRSMGYQLEQGVPLPVPGEVFVFGRVGAGDGKDLKVNGRTGVGWKLPLQPGAEVQVRSGTALSCNGLPVPTRVLEESQLLVEVQYRWQLLRWAGLEYQGTAFPSEQNRIDQDLGVVFPLGPVGRFRLGTRHSWQQQAQPWTENLQLQLGSSLRW